MPGLPVALAIEYRHRVRLWRADPLRSLASPTTVILCSPSRMSSEGSWAAQIVGSQIGSRPARIGRGLLLGTQWRPTGSPRMWRLVSSLVALWGVTGPGGRRAVKEAAAHERHPRGTSEGAESHSCFLEAVASACLCYVPCCTPYTCPRALLPPPAGSAPPAQVMMPQDFRRCGVASPSRAPRIARPLGNSSSLQRRPLAGSPGPGRAEQSTVLEDHNITMLLPVRISSFDGWSDPTEPRPAASSSVPTMATPPVRR